MAGPRHLKKMVQMQGIKTNIVIFTSAVVFLATLPDKAAGGAGQPISASHIKPVCDFKAALETVNGRVLDHIEAATANAKQAFMQLVRTAVYVEKNFKGKATTALEVLSDYYARSADAALQLAQGQELKSNLQALRDSARAQGAIDEFLQIMAGTSASGTHGCLGADELGNNPVKGNPGLVSLQPNCGILQAELTRAQTTAAAFTPQGYTSNKHTGATGPTPTPGNTGECALTTVSGTFKGINPSGGGNLNQQFEMAAGFFKTSASGLTMQATTDLKTPAGKPTRLVAAFQAHITTSKARNELHQTDINKVKLTEAFKQAMRHIVLKAKTAASTEHDADLEAKTTATFGAPEQFSQNFKAKIDNEEIPKGISGDENNPKNLGSINDIAQLYRIFFHYKDLNTKALENKISELEKQINKGASKTPEQICNDIGDSNESKCNTTKGCIYNKTGEENKKCTLSEEGKKAAATQEEKANQEKGEKDANKEDKCSEKKKEGDCTGNCKWDGKECKDSSFLLNKKFALSAISAVFAALLF